MLLFDRRTLPITRRREIGQGSNHTYSAAHVHWIVRQIYGVWFVLVLSIAVLVLVLDSIFAYRFCSLDQPSDHRYDSFQVRYSAEWIVQHATTGREQGD